MTTMTASRPQRRYGRVPVYTQELPRLSVTPAMADAIVAYADEHDLGLAEAMRRVLQVGLTHIDDSTSD